ncbi:MAG: type III-B CRISPR module RAMP protein Cmr6 [Deltaproteobacteria bacterium]|nr:MAG: type III-B CRISPR module RAMP protein Cmr6 [Deltaproteobacteria bacterium]
MRPVGRQINEALADGIHNANFGLVFNKWLEIEDRGNNKFKTKIHNDRQPLVKQYGHCAPRNGLAMEVLRKRHVQQSNCCEAMKKAGYTVLVFEAALVSPFISGLGMTHPTETGMVLDWDSGLPYVPAPSQKGVLRLAYVLDTIRHDPDQAKEENGEHVWYEDDEFRTLFGYTADRDRDDGLVGRIVVLDAHPLEVPALAEDILNPHYPDYYGKKTRNGQQVGPTEDQNPIPVKFLVMRPGIRFVFRVLLRYPLAGDPVKDTEKLVGLVRDAMHTSLEEEGLGAKTALGYGRFRILGEKEPVEVKGWVAKAREKQEQIKYPWRPFVQYAKAIDDWRGIKEFLLDEKVGAWLQHPEVIASFTSAFGRCADTIQDWGQLKQRILNDETIKAWQANQEVAKAIKTVAERVRRKNYKKWTADRDQAVAEWLAPSGIEWKVLDSGTSEAPGDADTASSPLLEKIRAYSDWGAFKSDPVEIAGLDRTCSLALCKKLREWKCNNKKAKNDKQKTWKALQERLRQV